MIAFIPLAVILLAGLYYLWLIRSMRTVRAYIWDSESARFREPVPRAAVRNLKIITGLLCAAVLILMIGGFVCVWIMLNGMAGDYSNDFATVIMVLVNVFRIMIYILAGLIALFGSVIGCTLVVDLCVLTFCKIGMRQNWALTDIYNQILTCCTYAQGVCLALGFLAVLKALTVG